MPDTRRAERLLALFSSPECAEGIVGDLSEESRNKSSLSFWRDVLTTTVALSAVTIDRAPFATLRHAGNAFAGLAAFGLLGLASVSFFPQYLGSAAAWLMMSLVWWSGALHSGASVVKSGEARGLTACVAVAIVAEALLFWFALTAGKATGLANLATIALAPMVMLAGATVARIRMVARENEIAE